MDATVKKRKNIDLNEKTFRTLSMRAVSNGTNLKSFIEKTLDEVAENIEEGTLYDYLIKHDKEATEYLSDEEQKEFEKEMGL